MIYRIEDKYILSDADMASMESQISTILPSDSAGKCYTISSLYFDDIFDSCYQETVAGNPIRTKYRIRIYNNSFDTIKLEIKNKKYNRTNKRSCIISKDEMDALINNETIPLSNTGSLDDPRVTFNLAISSKGLRPKVIVTYERFAYTYPAGNVRITFDKNVRGSTRTEAFNDDGILNLTNLVYSHPTDNNQILEIKYDELLPLFIAQTLENNKMLQCTNSKYCICRELEKH